VLLIGIVSLCNLQNSLLESSCVFVALIKNYSTSKPLKGFPEKSQILSCDTLVANERICQLSWTYWCQRVVIVDRFHPFIGFKGP
jgi:hypothetical protein